mmetsp:Transcript_166324/g.404111  ORF Transcript_166324/g.404111 Transcript_166324/m.404111 type:complete len:322 (-) Transcript_166324:50-1015(-)
MAPTPFRRQVVLATVLLLLGCSHSADAYSMDDVDFGDTDDLLGLETTSMLQVSGELNKFADKVAAPPIGSRDLAMAYLPYNFGHTVAKVALSHGIKWGDCGEREGSAATCIGKMKSDVTGCDLMYTPGKYWPKDLAQRYFGNRTVFGILRDPYERMVAQFRGSGYAKDPHLHAICDVNTAVKAMMRDYLEEVKAGKPYAANCNKLPQAEFFDQPYGATIAVDNRHFPLSANELLMEHGYSDLLIQTEEVDHVSGCDHVWAGDLDSEAKALVRQVYGRDFELLCKHFGYCDTLEDTCITTVPGMCPSQLFTWNSQRKVYLRK